MTSLLHLAIPFKPIKSTLTQFYPLFSPPSNAFLHLPCASARPTPPQANAGHPNHRGLTTSWWVCFATAQLALASAGSQRQRDTCRGQGRGTPPRADGPARAGCRPPLPIPPTEPPRLCAGSHTATEGSRGGLSSWDGVPCWPQQPAPPKPTQNPTLGFSQGT